MMDVRIVHDPKEAYKLLSTRSRYNYIYQFHNLACNQWEKVICYGLYEQDELQELVMLHIGYHIPVLLAASFESEEYNPELIRAIKPLLPPKFYTHMDRRTLEKVFSKENLNEIEEYMNMGLCEYKKLISPYGKRPVRLGFKEIKSIEELLEAGNPDAWLDNDLLKLDKNFGIILEDKLVSFAGIHAYSEEYQVAAVAQITTDPNYRRKGYAEMVLKALIEELRSNIEFIGLNVKVDNHPAINCYKKFGFREFGKFIACEVNNN